VAVLAYNPGNFLWRLALPKGVRHWSLTTLREKLIKIGKVVRHAKYLTFHRCAETVGKIETSGAPLLPCMQESGRRQA
jgi:hypothetical protein